MDPQPNVLQREYRLRFLKTEEYRREMWRILCRDYFGKLISSDMAVLDLGCGWGEFINHIHAARKFAMDLNPDAARRLEPGIEFLRQDCSAPWQLPPESLDIVFTSNFLEHLRKKSLVEQTIEEACRCLKPGGLMICMGPNVRYLPGAHWDFWDHFIPLTERSLAELLELKGFDIRLKVPRFLPYSMSTGITPPLFLVAWYLKLPFVWPWFGKQFVVVGKKRADEPIARSAEA